MPPWLHLGWSEGGLGMGACGVSAQSPVAVCRGCRGCRLLCCPSGCSDAILRLQNLLPASLLVSQGGTTSPAHPKPTQPRGCPHLEDGVMPRGQPGPGVDLHVLPPLSTTTGWGLKKKGFGGSAPSSACAWQGFGAHPAPRSKLGSWLLPVLQELMLPRPLRDPSCRRSVSSRD